MDEILYWIWFSNIATYKNALMRELFLKVKDPKIIYAMTEKELKEYKFLTLLTIQKLLDKDLDCSKKIYEKCKLNNYNIITYDDKNYPLRLKNIEDFPYLLYHRGKELFLDEKLTIGIVGTRAPSAYGESVARNISRDLSLNGAIVISGMAKGIDAMGHYGAVDVGAPTVAILGTGIDKIYPYENKKLYEYMLDYGAIYSEFPPGAKVYPGYFPQRNRIISGLSLGVLIVEAPEKSGSLITANIALNQGKDIFSVPNLITNPVAQGSNNLIKDGAAKCINKVDDILEEYSYLFEFAKAPKKYDVTENNNQIIKDEFINSFKNLTPMQTEIVKFLSEEYISIEVIAQNSKIPMNLLLSEMTMLEIMKVVVSGPLKKFKLNINK